MLKSTFGFQNDQELINLYNLSDKKQGFFESRFLTALMKRLSYGKRYFLEKLIAKFEKEKTLPFYMKKMYISQHFCKVGGGEIQKRKIGKFLEALDFINRELKKNDKLQHSDFAISFLNAFNF
jgi:hypothetical protein